MNDTVLRNARVLLDTGFRDNAAVALANGRIAAIGDVADTTGDAIDLTGHLLLPGFVDTQVNGGGGVLFNDAPDVDGIAAIAAAHRRFGTTTLLPTLISDDLAVVAAALDAVDAAIKAGVPGIRGIHVEGPFLNPARHGIHDPAKLRRIDAEALALLARPRRGRVLVTLAPELTPDEAVSTLKAAGVIVAAGHSDADHATARAAFDAGITGVTHLFNAMSPMASRAPGLVGATLDDDRITAGIIVDGHHVAPATLRVALRAKGTGLLMLVTDAMSTVGSGLTSFELGGVKYGWRKGRLTDKAGTLAGSALTMIDAVRNAVTMMNVPLEVAVAMASAVPSRFLKLDDEIGDIAIGKAADLIALDADGHVAHSWIGGVRQSFDR